MPSPRFGLSQLNACTSNDLIKANQTCYSFNSVTFRQELTGPWASISHAVAHKGSLSSNNFLVSNTCLNPQMNIHKSKSAEGISGCLRFCLRFADAVLHFMSLHQETLLIARLCATVLLWPALDDVYDSSDTTRHEGIWKAHSAAKYIRQRHSSNNSCLMNTPHWCARQ